MNPYTQLKTGILQVLHIMKDYIWDGFVGELLRLAGYAVQSTIQAVVAAGTAIQNMVAIINDIKDNLTLDYVLDSVRSWITDEPDIKELTKAFWWSADRHQAIRIQEDLRTYATMKWTNERLIKFLAEDNATIGCKSILATNKLSGGGLLSRVGNLITFPDANCTLATLALPEELENKTIRYFNNTNK